MSVLKAESCKRFIIGDSHVGVLKRSQAQTNFTNEWTIVPFGPGGLLATPFYVEGEETIEIIESRIKQRVSRISEVDKSQNLGKSASIYFSGPLNSNRILNSNIWSDYRPSEILDGVDSFSPISSQCLKELLWEDCKYSVGFVEALVNKGWSVIVLEAPKPFRHHRAVNRYGNELVSFLDKEYRRLVSDRLAESGVKILEVPKVSYDEEGFTFDIYRSPKANDNHHANEKFGLMMWQVIGDKLK